MNEMLYNFGKALVAGGIFGFIFGIIYLFSIAIFYTDYEMNNKLADFVIFYYIAYCLIVILTGNSICDKYNNHHFPKNSKKKNSLEIDIKNKTSKV
jgi:hypothetical protein